MYTVQYSTHNLYITYKTIANVPKIIIEQSILMCSSMYSIVYTVSPYVCLTLPLFTHTSYRYGTQQDRRDSGP